MYKATRGKRTLHQYQLNYLAGFFDGEGSIFIAKIHNKRSGNIWYRLSVSVANTDKRPIELLRETFTPDQKSFIYRPKRKSSYKDVYQWMLTGNTAVRFLKEIGPRLLVKKEQAVLGMNFQEWRNENPAKGIKRDSKYMKTCDDYYHKLKVLNGTE